MIVIAFVLFGLGTLITFLNFYLSFVRYPLYRLRGGATDEYKWVSGAPLVGSLLLWVSAAVLRQYPGFAWAAIVISLFDTGGFHWFIASILWHSFAASANKRKK
jgi:predicted membrane channel-forming protein YqfA (hemolysin III family)